ncbi:hypothetical protein BFP97_10485 [Roseivirga sp. 4D4]|uniref:DinB family protein n=1 Tax=Roseivirga sp. 4D4 TaxID=1889784 RepID=UPI0008529B14|nr:DinB family protein [Roseivirga sp. 4D4]OEK01916.1 hypothetical protein BFP97_10485 [Roseivirga sp. 4D4]
MKKLVVLMMTALTMISPVEKETLSKKERKFATKYLESSMKDIFKSIKNLTPEQWNYQASPDSWSVAGACEHLLIAEQAIHQNITQNIIKNEKFRVIVPEATRVSDQTVIDIISDRSPAKRVKTAPPFEPKGLVKSPEDFIAKFKAARQINIDFTKSSQDDLKAYYFDSPAGKISAYQWIILLSAHAQRHHKQMKEVMENQGFPAQ